MAKILVLHGPNLNMLGEREPDTYGHTPLDAIDNQLTTLAGDHGHQLRCLQSNAEHVLIEEIHLAKNDRIDYIIINPAAFTHSSIALRDALLAVDIPFIEVHLSNIYQREAFRAHSYFSDIALGVISGFGPNSYSLALHAIIQQTES